MVARRCWRRRLLPESSLAPGGGEGAPLSLRLTMPGVVPRMKETLAGSFGRAAVPPAEAASCTRRQL